MDDSETKHPDPSSAPPRARLGLPASSRAAAPPSKELPFDARNWKAVLQQLIDRNNWRRAANNAVVSNQTRQDRAAFYFAFFRTLRELGVFIDPRHLRESHVQKVAAWWVERGHAPATFQKCLSHLRTFSAWIGKPGMVRCPERYVPFPETARRTYVTHADKGWEANGVDVTTLIDQIRAFDPHVDTQLLVMQTFSLRPKEAIMLRPLQNVVPADKGCHSAAPLYLGGGGWDEHPPRVRQAQSSGLRLDASRASGWRARARSEGRGIAVRRDRAFPPPSPALDLKAYTSQYV